jgi:conjugative transfer signal peptidase TraF
MPAAHDLPVTGWADEFRRAVADRRRRRRRRRLLFAILIGTGTTPLLLTLVVKLPLLLVWNATASAPVGLYRVNSGKVPARGDLVIVRTPEAVRRLAARRRYVPANVPLLKRIAAAEGDRVCASGGSIRIDGRIAAERRPTDPAGRTMPWWSGCRLLGPGEIFLLTDSPYSFDGRYFGITRRRDLIGRAVLLWAQSAQRSDG